MAIEKKYSPNSKDWTATVKFVENELRKSDVDSASKLTTPRNIILDGDVTGTTLFDGSQDVTITTTLTSLGTIQELIDLKAPLESPNFIGIPIAPTAIFGTNTSQIATTAFVQEALDNISSGGSVFSAEKLTTARTISLTGDVTGSVSFDGSSNVSITAVIVDDSHNHIISNIDGLQSALDLKSPIANPTFTGVVTAPSFVGPLTGNASTATKLYTARTISLTGDVTGSVSFDGSQNVSITAVIVDDSHNHIISNIDGLQDALNLKSPIANPAFNGTVTAPSFVGPLTGNASTATELLIPRTISLSGVTNTGQLFDGSSDIIIPITAIPSSLLTGIISNNNLPSSSESNKGIVQLATVEEARLGVNNTKAVTPEGLSSAIDLTNGEIYSITLLASDWVGSESPYTYEITSIENVTSDSNIHTIAGDGINQTQLSQLILAQIVDGGLDINSIVLKAIGIKPTIDIPIRIIRSNSLYVENHYFDDNVPIASKILAGIVELADSEEVLAGIDEIKAVTSKDISNTYLKLNGGTLIGNVAAPSFIGSLTGNASTATKLATARTINGVSFDGTQNITINAIDSTPRIASSLLGVANGVATLDSNGLVPSSQLPSYVDDILEYTNLAGLPASGETSKLYVTLDTNKVYRWSGSIYVEISANASTADAAIKLATARTISLSGDVTGSVSFDGSSNVTITAVIVDDSHNHIISNIDGLQAALDGRALLSHTHTIANVTGLQTAIDARAPIASPTFTGVVTSPSFVGPLTGNASTATSAISVTGSQATDISNALAHKSNNGTDHSYINQDLKTSATVQFAKLGVGVASPVESIEVSGKVKSSNGFVAGNFEIVYNATESSLDFCLLS